MALIALCLPALPSHAAVHGVLGRALAARGHKVAMVGGHALGALAAREGLPFADLGGGEPGLLGAGLVRTLWATARVTGLWVRRGPEVLGRLAPDLVIADQAEPGAGLAAEAAGLRRATLAVALPMDRHEALPPPFVDWPFLPGEEGARRNRGGWRVADPLMALQARALAKGCADHGLPRRTRISDWISDDLDLRQLVPELDFPHPLGPGAAPVGPLRETATPLTLDPDELPIVFASLGTLQGNRRGMLTAIAAAAEGMGVRLLLAHAGGLTEAQARALPGRVETRALWPQRAVLARAAACITHAGMNTVLDCVAARVPMVAIPLAFEQPATAARLAHHGLARVVPARRATPARIAEALRDALGNAAMRAALADVSTAQAAAGGVARAVALIEARLPDRRSDARAGVQVEGSAAAAIRRAAVQAHGRAAVPDPGGPDSTLPRTVPRNRAWNEI